MGLVDKMVILWLLHTVEKRISDKILFSSSSRQIWLDLEQRFSQSDGTKFFQVKKDLYSISQGNQDIPTYFTNIKKLWDEHDLLLFVPTCSCGINCATYVYDQKMKEKSNWFNCWYGWMMSITKYEATFLCHGLCLMSMRHITCFFKKSIREKCLLRLI